ncbi:MAG: AraC family transcriptional regulator [Ginsengibacter sp.]
MSKAFVEILTSSRGTSFSVKRFDKKGFEAPFHFHPEYELTCITEGEGKRFVGNNMSGFQKNDLVLMGANLPHCWKLDQDIHPKASSIVIQFKYDFLGREFWNTSEMENIQRLLKRSEAGIEFRGKIKEEIRDSMVQCFNEINNFIHLIQLLKILNRLSVSKEYSLLNKKNSIPVQSDHNRERNNKVFAYIVENFHDDISLNEASKTIGMTPNAFCKYFKKTTRKTFIETVTDYRINFARQQLIETDKSIADVCFESGFKDMSHFYKMFTARMEISPINYRKQFLKETMNG